MFIHDEDRRDGSYLITQASHAWLAHQLADHWGNRRFARPAPRSEVLTAVLLHDSGWTEFDGEPVVDEQGRPRTFNRMQVTDHVEIWRRCVARAAMHSRYAALLVASHFDGLAGRKTADLLEAGDTAGGRMVQAFRAELQRQQKTWRESLVADARYQPYLEGEGRLVNSSLLDVCDRVSVYLCASLAPDFRAEGRTADGGSENISFKAVGRRRWRVSPWPLEGDRLKLQCEGRRLSELRFADDHSLREAVRRAPVERLTFTLERPSASAAKEVSTGP